MSFSCRNSAIQFSPCLAALHNLGAAPYRFYQIFELDTSQAYNSIFV